jgi:hypothetical protein
MLRLDRDLERGARERSRGNPPESQFRTLPASY